MTDGAARVDAGICPNCGRPLRWERPAEQISWAWPGDDRLAAQLSGTAVMLAPMVTAAAWVMFCMIRK